MAGHGSHVLLAMRFGPKGLTAVPMPHGPATPKAEAMRMVPAWRFAFQGYLPAYHEAYGEQHLSVEIKDWQKWNELMDILLSMNDEARAKILKKWQESHKNFDCAEAGMEAIVRKLYPSLSPMKAGADEYDQIMAAQTSFGFGGTSKKGG